LQRLALRTKDWFPVVTAGLSCNAVTSSLPGGSAAGAAVQFHIQTTAGFDTDTAVGGLTAFSLLEVGGLLALSIFALPAILAGVPVSRGLVHTVLLGIAAFVLYAIFGVIVLRADWQLATLGRVAQGLWNRVTRGHRPPVTGLDQRLLAERDTIRAVLGANWQSWRLAAKPRNSGVSCWPGRATEMHGSSRAGCRQDSALRRRTQGGRDTPAHPPDKPRTVTGHATLRPGLASACPAGDQLPYQQQGWPTQSSVQAAGLDGRMGRC
jgi:hypothetical protein